MKQGSFSTSFKEKKEGLSSILKNQAQREADYREEKFANNPKIRKAQKELVKVKNAGNDLQLLECLNDNSISFLKHMRHHNRQMQGRTQRIVDELEYEAKFGHLLGNGTSQDDGIALVQIVQPPSPNRKGDSPCNSPTRRNN